MSANGGGMRRRRGVPFVQMTRPTVRDKELSFKARGILLYILDHPNGWDVRSDAIARAGKEGRDAVRSGLNELAARGYYRLERRKMLDGTFQMGTAISETPVEEWIADNAEYGGLPVTVIQQRDESFLVLHKDGSLTADGFTAEDDEDYDPDDVELEDDGPDDDPGSGAGSETPGPGFQAPVPGPENPSPGKSVSGGSGPISKKVTGEGEGTTGAAAADAGDADIDGSLPGLRLVKDTTPAKAEDPLKGVAQGIAERWPEVFTRITRSRAVNYKFHALRVQADQALKAGFTVEQIQRVLAELQVLNPSAAAWQAALTQLERSEPITGHARSRAGYGAGVGPRHIDAPTPGRDVGF